MAERYVAVAGNIGAGKTTLVAYLKDRYGLVPVFEPFDTNPYLDDFYADMKAYAFHSQMWFLAHKFRLHLEITGTAGAFIQDRTIYEDAEIFATHLYRSKRMSERDWATYQDLYQAMQQSLRPPDLLIYLRCPVPVIRKRIKERGRPSEQNIPPTYLKQLDALYEEWLARWDQSPKLVWDTDQADYLSDLVHRLEFHKAIEKLLAKV